MKDWGRFTLLGGSAVEALLADIVHEVADAFAARLRPDQYRALVLIGGYGRGEGGIEIRDGGEHPHNNLDFLLVARHAPGTDPALLKADLDAILQPISPASWHRHGPGRDPRSQARGRALPGDVARHALRAQDPSRG